MPLLDVLRASYKKSNTVRKSAKPLLVEKLPVVEPELTPASIQVDGVFVMSNDPKQQFAPNVQFDGPTMDKYLDSVKGKVFTTPAEKKGFFWQLSKTGSTSSHGLTHQYIYVYTGHPIPVQMYITSSAANGCSSQYMQGFGTFFTYIDYLYNRQATMLGRVSKIDWKAYGFTFDDLLRCALARWAQITYSFQASPVYQLTQAPGNNVDWLHKNGAITVASFTNPCHSERIIQGRAGHTRIIIADIRKLMGPYNPSTLYSFPEIVYGKALEG